MTDTHDNTKGSEAFQNAPGAAEPLVSVCCVTYNHERFLAQALDSFLMQKTSFPFEILVHDDASTDGTVGIIQAYQERFPGRIRTILQTENQFRQGRSSFPLCMTQAAGRYLAICEGDDYWTDEYKLAKQVEFLEAHPEFVLVFHNCEIINTRAGGYERRKMHAGLPQDTFATRDLFQQWFIPTASIMYRWPAGFAFPDWYDRCQSGDIPLLLLLSLHGKFKYLDEVMSVYRLHDGGLSLTHSEMKKVIGMTYMYESFNHYTQRQFADDIYAAILEENRIHHPYSAALCYSQDEVRELKARLQEQETKSQEWEAKSHGLEEKCHELSDELHDIRSSFSWRSLSWLRDVCDRLRHPFTRGAKRE